MRCMLRFSMIAFPPVIAFAICTFGFEASAKTSALMIDAESGIRDFVMANGAAERASQPPGSSQSNTFLSIPSIYIYSPRGVLVYRGTASTIEKNVAVLGGMPETVEQLAPITGAPSLNSMLELVPAFKAEEKNILQDEHYVVYVITMKRDQPTPTQKAVMELRNRGKDVPVDTLVIRLKE
jgi:hypothetical protein